MDSPYVTTSIYYTKYSKFKMKIGLADHVHYKLQLFSLQQNILI